MFCTSSLPFWFGKRSCLNDAAELHELPRILQHLPKVDQISIDVVDELRVVYDLIRGLREEDGASTEERFDVMDMLWKHVDYLGRQVMFAAMPF